MSLTVLLLLGFNLLVQGASIQPRDEVDDMVQAGIETLKGYDRNTTTYVKDVLARIANTIQYYDHTSEVFAADGRAEADELFEGLNELATQLTAEAINAGKPNAVTCISQNLDTATNDINGKLSTLESDFQTAADKDDPTILAAQNDLSLLLSTLPAIYASNAGNIETCVSQVCIDTNLASGKKSYDAVDNNVASAEDKVSKLRADFNQKTINLLHEFRFAARDVASKQSNKMNRCL